MRALLSLVAITWIAACSPSRPAAVDSGPIPEVDAWRPDAWRLDTGPPPPPTCGGTATRCADRASGECTAGMGCSLARCTGTPSCIDHATQSSCGRDFGCSWDGYLCSGTPDQPCSAWSGSTECFEAGCTWNDFNPPCSGAAVSCAMLQGADCTAQPGCHALDVDAGPPDGGSDAGHDGGNDAAVMCTVTGGTCSPFVTSSCGANQTCIANGTAPHCTVSAFTLHNEGEACTNDNECAWGLDCHAVGGGPLQCTRFCHAGSTTDCGASSQCMQLAYTGSTCLRYCVPMAPTCDLATQNCATGSSCYVYASGGAEVTGCFATGSIAVGGSCNFLNDCVRGASCFGSASPVCRQTCNTTADCTTGTCTGSSASHHYCL